jgi:hypothetical protein
VVEPEKDALHFTTTPLILLIRKRLSDEFSVREKKMKVYFYSTQHPLGMNKTVPICLALY